MLHSSSSFKIDGIVGIPAFKFLLITSIFFLRFLLSGSCSIQNYALLNVYSCPQYIKVSLSKVLINDNDLNISSYVPSNNLPQLNENKVSPVNNILSLKK